MSDFFHSTAWSLLLLLVSVLVVIVTTILHRRRQIPHTRELRVLGDLRDKLGQAAESGRPFHIALGNGALGAGNTISSLAGLKVLEKLVDAAVSRDVAPVITVGNPTLFALAQDVLRRAHDRGRIPEFYDASRVRFIAPSSLAYSAGAIPVGVPEDVTAHVVVGVFGSEVSLMADISNGRRQPTTAAVDSSEAIGALYPATNRLAVGEELYAAGALISGHSQDTAGLIAQDILRFVLVLAILGTAAVALVGG